MKSVIGKMSNLSLCESSQAINYDLIREKFPSLAKAPDKDLELAGVLNCIVPINGLLPLKTAINKSKIEHASKVKNTISAFAYYVTVKNITEFLGSVNIADWGLEHKEAWLAEKSVYIKNAISTFINQFSELICAASRDSSSSVSFELGFSHEDTNAVFELLRQIILNYDCVASGKYFPAIQLSPIFGAYHDRMMSNLIKRVINIFLTVFKLNRVKVNCTKAVKERMSFTKREQGGYCSTCAYSYERLPSYPVAQSGIKMLLFAAPNSINFNPIHKLLANGPLIDDAKYNIIFENTRNYFLIAHDMCEKLININLIYCGSISISYNMVWASILYAIDRRDQQAKLLTLHTKRR